jgi:hypothetical protein
MSQTVTTVLQLINKILVRLRESEVGTVDETDYSLTLLRLLNDAKREVEDSFDWVSLQNTITVTTAAGTQTYDVENAGAGAFTNQRSRLIDVYNTTTDVRLTPRPFEWIRIQTQANNEDQQEPFAYAHAGYNNTQSMKIRFFLVPDAVYAMDVEVIIPEEDMTTETDFTKVPWYPVYLKALALAIRERGEDEGEASSEMQMAYQQALGDAVAFEQKHKWQAQGGGDWIVLGDY